MVPENPLVEVSRRIIKVLAPNINITRRQLATEWLSELYDTVRAWNESFIEFLKTYPGFVFSSNPKEYEAFFKELLAYERGLDERVDAVKTDLCGPLKHLYARFPEDFSWLQQEDRTSYDALYSLVGNSYRNELGVIGIAQRFIDDIFTHHTPGYGLPKAQRIHCSDFLMWHVMNYQTVVKLIDNYDIESSKTVREICKISEDADTHFVNVDGLRIRRRPGSFPSESVMEVTETTNRPQIQHALLYRIMAFAFGISFVLVIFATAIWFPKPSTFQLRVFTTILSIAVAGCATVMTGLLDVKAKLGKQLTIGGTGALAVFVIVYLVNPAVL